MRSHAHPWFAEARYALAVKRSEEADDALRRSEESRRWAAQFCAEFGHEVFFAPLVYVVPSYNARLVIE